MQTHSPCSALIQLPDFTSDLQLLLTLNFTLVYCLLKQTVSFPASANHFLTEHHFGITLVYLCSFSCIHLYKLCLTIASAALHCWCNATVRSSPELFTSCLFDRSCPCSLFVWFNKVHSCFHELLVSVCILDLIHPLNLALDPLLQFVLRFVGKWTTKGQQKKFSNHNKQVCWSIS